MRINRSDVPPFLIGLAALPAQAVLLRELLARGGGNELAVTIYLAVWLLGSALGARWWGRLLGSPDPRFGGLLAGGAIVAVVGVSVARFIPQPGGLPGEIPSPFAIALWGACVLFPPAFRTAGLFPLAVLRQEDSGTGPQPARPGPAAGFVRALAGGAPGRAYAAEAIGALTGGLAVTFLVLLRVPSLTILLLDLSILMLAISRKAVVRLAAGVLLLVAILGGSGAIDRVLFRAAWEGRHRGFHLVEHAMTPSRTLILAEREGQKWLLVDDALADVVDDAYRDEAIAALLLGVVPRVERVLLVDFGGAGVAAALARAGVREVTCLLPDREDTLLVPPASGVDYEIGDPRAALRWSRGDRDVIVISGGETAGIGANRLWTAEAFRAMALLLSPRGAIVVLLPGGEAAPVAGADERRMSIAAALAEAAGPVQAMDVDRFVLVASGRSEPASLSADSLAHRLRRSGRILPSYPPERFAAEYPPDRRVHLRAADANRDGRPVAVASAIRRWSRMAGLSSDPPKGLPIAMFILILVVVFVPWARGAGGAGTSVLLATAAVSMGLDLLVLMTYQARVGMLYGGLGALLGAFVGGTALGAILAGKIAARRTSRRALVCSCLAQMILAGAAGLVLVRLPIAPPLLSSLPYAMISVLLGASCGFPFPLVARGSTAGSAWSTDALGGIIGAVLFLNVISWGIVPTGFALGALSLAAMARVLAARS